MPANTRDELIAAGVCDRVIDHVVGAGLHLASIMNSQPIDDEVTRQIRDATEELDAAARELHTVALACVVRERDAPTETPDRATTSTSATLAAAGSRLSQGSSIIEADVR